MRSTAHRQYSGSDVNPFDKVTPGEIQMQSFSDGLPPPPPTSHSWKRIDRWAEDNYAELYDNLSEGCTQNDLNELEHALDCSLPMDLRESLQIHDGQERGGNPTGIIFGCMLLDCEEIVQEWKQWQRVNEDFLTGATLATPRYPSKAFGSSSHTPPPPNQSANPHWREELMSKQDSQPPNAVQKVYSHPAWIPVARDWGGNILAIDLAPGPAGKWGQVIIFGRDYDCKYVVARSFAAFLAMVADDLSSKNVHIDEEEGSLNLLEFKSQNVEPPYLEILRWRTDQKYGRRKSSITPINGKLKTNTNVAPTYSSSPHGSPLENDRGRSPQRFFPRSLPAQRGHVSSPLARVHEEQPLASRLSLSSNASADNIRSPLNRNDRSFGTDTSSLINGQAPRPGGERISPKTSLEGSDKENTKEVGSKDAGLAKQMDGTVTEMRTVEL